MAAWLRELTLTAMFLGGIAAVAYGCAQAWHPAIFVIPGAAAVSIAVMAEIVRSRSRS